MKNDFLMIRLFKYYNPNVISDHLRKYNINHTIFESKNTTIVCLPVNQDPKTFESFKVTTSFCYKFKFISLMNFLKQPKKVQNKIPLKFWRIVDKRDVCEIDMDCLQKVCEVTDKENINIQEYLDSYEKRKKMISRCLQFKKKLIQKDPNCEDILVDDLFDDEIFCSVFEGELKQSEIKFTFLLDELKNFNATYDDAIKVLSRFMELKANHIKRLENRLCMN